MILKTHKNTLIAYGTIWDGDATYFVSSLARLESQYTDVVVRFHTSGGSVFDGNIMYNACNVSNNIDKIVIDGIAASMGSIIMLSRQKVEIVENGYVMIHAPSSGSSGNAKDMESKAKLLRLVEKNFISKLMARTGKPKSEVEKWMDGSDYWFDAQECLEMGLVTKIIPAKINTPLPVTNPENMDNQEVYNMYASLMTFDFNKDNININSLTNMKQPLIQAFSLSGVNAQSSDTAIIEAVKAKLQAVEQERDNAVNKLTAQRKEQVKVILDQHEGKTFAKEKREVYAKIGETSGIEALVTVLGIPAPKNNTAPNITSLIQGGNSETGVRADWTYEKWQTEDPKGLEAMSKETPSKFDQLYKNQYPTQ